MMQQQSGLPEKPVGQLFGEVYIVSDPNLAEYDATA
jgi:hypothetical protein